MMAADLLRRRVVERDALLRQVTELLRGDARIVAAWLAGSLGCGTSDGLSDIDLWIIAGDDACSAVIRERRDCVARAGRPLLIQEVPANAPPGGAYLHVLYPGEVGPQEVDWYWQSRAIARIPHDGRILFNRGGVPIAARPAQETLEQRVPATSARTIFFWAMVPIVAKKIARRQPEGAFDMLRSLQRAVTATRQFIDDTGESGHSPQPAQPIASTVAQGQLPPFELGEQLRYLRALAAEMRALTVPLQMRGVQVPGDALPPIFGFLDFAESVLAEWVRSRA